MKRDLIIEFSSTPGTARISEDLQPRSRLRRLVDRKLLGVDIKGRWDS